MPAAPEPHAPLSDWAAAIRADVRANSGLAVESAKSVAGATAPLFAFLGLHGIKRWRDTEGVVLLEWPAEPLRDRHGEVLRERDPDEERRQRWKLRHIITAAIRLGAPVPLLDDGGDLIRFLYPAPRPKREQGDPEEIAAAVAAWRPQRWRHGSLRNLSEVLPEVRERVLAAEPDDVDEARRCLRVLAGFALWARDDRHSDLATMHTPNNAETWVMRVNAAEDDSWKNRTRGVLRKLGPTVNPGAWPRPPRPLPPRKVVAPYAPKEERAFRAAASLPRHDRRARLWLVISAPGAGLNGPQISAAEYDDLAQRADGRWEIGVRGDRARRVPIRREYSALADELAAMQDRSRFIASDKPGAVNQIAQRIRVGDRSLSLTKSRNTFLAAHIAAGTPPAALSRVAGGVAYATLDRLLTHVADRLDPDDAVKQALGP